MPGDNQHFIPRHVLQGFAIRGRPKFAWEYRTGVAPVEKRLKKLAAAYHFYSEPRADGGATLDDEITDYENGRDGLARRISRLRDEPAGPLANAALAAEVVCHLSLRNDNVRGSLTHGVKLMAQRAFGLFGQEEALRRLIGIDGKEPNQKFKDNVVRPILTHPDFPALGLPEGAITRVVFGMARERFPESISHTMPLVRMTLAHLHETAESVVRNSHNKALAKGLVPDVRRAALAELDWSILETTHDIVLPDCVAIGITAKGHVSPLFLSDTDELATAVMALTSNRLLIGRKAGAAPFHPHLFNLHAIACSEEFFVSSVASDELVDWSRHIGVNSRTVLHQGLAEVFAAYAPPMVTPSAQIDPPSEIMDSSDSAIQWQPTFDISFVGCADEPTAEKIASTTYGIAAGLAETMPLGRLDGITFAEDYPAALAALDRGIPGVGPPATTDEDNAVGVAMAPVVFRDNTVKAHIVVHGCVGRALIDPDEAKQKWALQVLAMQFSEVACVEVFDTAFPGIMLQPFARQFDLLRYRHVSNVWGGYFSSRVSAVFSPETGDVYRALLIAALQRATAEIPRWRLDYRFHGNVPRLMEDASKYVGYVLSHAAHLIGHYDGLTDVPMDQSGALGDELKRLGLTAWFELYGRDLRALWEQLGNWKSLDEFLALGFHVERLLWPFGLFLWEMPDGTCRLEAPIQFDRRRLAIEITRQPLRAIETIVRNLIKRLFGRRAKPIA